MEYERRTKFPRIFVFKLTYWPALKEYFSLREFGMSKTIETEFIVSSFILATFKE